MSGIVSPVHEKTILFQNGRFLLNSHGCATLKGTRPDGTLSGESMLAVIIGGAQIEGFATLRIRVTGLAVGVPAWF